MRAVTFHGRADVRCEEVPDPRLSSPGDAIVRVEQTAICGSDMHVYHERERGADHGTVMGHEFIGTIVEVGPAVSRLRPGQRVLSPFTTSCGECFFCRDGLTARCERGELFGWVSGGLGLHGAQAEAVRVPLADGTLVPIPDDLGADEALLLGDVLSTGYFCAKQAAVRPGGVYAVIGCGPVGLMAVVGARALGAERVLAIDGVDERLELARRFGAEPVDLRSSSTVEAIRAVTAGRGVDAALEAVGTPDSSRSAIELVRPGGTISIVGVHTEPHFSFSPAEAYDRNLTIRVGRCPARAMVDELVPIVRSGRFDVGAIVTHRRALADAPEAYRVFDNRLDGCVKMMLRP